LFLSAADTELASLAQAHKLGQSGPNLRLANFLSLTHPMSVDAYCRADYWWRDLLALWA
jgi:cobaltochelatase CobN